MEAGRVLNLIVRAWSGGVSSVFMGLSYWLSSLAKVAGHSALAFAAVGAAVGVLGAAVLKAIGATVAQAINYDTAMRKIATITETTGDGFVYMKDKVLELSRTVPKSIDELAAGLYDIKSVITDDRVAMQLLGLAAKASSLALVDTKDVSKMLASAMVAYNGTMKDAVRWTDQVTAAVSIGRGEYADYARSMAQLVGYGNMLGVSFGELAGALAFMTRRGYNASMSTTYLRNVMMKIIKPSAEAVTNFKKLGIAWGGDAVRGAGGLFPYLKKIGEAVGWNEKALAKLFPNLRALPVLFAMARDPGNDLAKVMKAVANSAGTLEERFKTAMEGPANQIQVLKNNFQEIAIRIGMTLIPILGALLRVIQPIVAKIAEWIQHNPELTRFYTIAVAISAIIMTMTGLFMATAAAIFLVMKVLGLGIGVLALAVGGVLGISGGLGTIFAKMITGGKDGKKAIGDLNVKVQELKDKLPEVEKWAKRIGVAIAIAFGVVGFNKIKAVIGNVGAALAGGEVKGAIAALARWLQTLWVKITLFPDLIKGIGASISTVFGGSTAVALAAIAAVLAIVIGVVVFLKENWVDVVRVWKYMVGPTIKMLKESFEEIKPAIEPLKASAKELWNSLKELKPVFELIGGIIVGLLVVAFGLLVGVLRGLGPLINGIIKIFGGLIKVVSGVVQVLVHGFSWIWAFITGDKKKQGEAWAALKDGAYKIWEGIKDIFWGALEGIWGFIKGFVKGVLVWFGTLYTTLTGKAQNWYTDTVAWFKALPGAVWKWMTETGTKAKNAVETKWNEIITWFKNLPETIWNGLVSLKDKVVSRITEMSVNAVTALGQFAINALNAIQEFVTGLPEKIWYAVGFALGWLIRFAIEAPSKIYFFAKLALKIIADWVVVTAAKFGSWVTSVVAKITNFVKTAPGKIESFAITTKNKIVAWAKDTYNRFVSWVNESVAKFVMFVRLAPGLIADFATMAYNKIAAWVRSIPARWQQFVNDTKAKFQAVRDGISQKIESAKGVLGGLLDYAATLPGKMWQKAKDIAAAFWRGFKKGLGIESPSYPEQALMAIGSQAAQTAADVVVAVRGMASAITALPALSIPNGVIGVNHVSTVRHEVAFGSLPAGLSIDLTGREVADLLNSDPTAVRDVARRVNLSINRDVR